MALENTGTAWVFGDDINTDLIMPGAAFLLPVEQQVTYCFSANRPGWTDLMRPGDIIVAGKNFGVGSGRPIGNVLAHLGVAGVIAASFNTLGLRNCVNYGVHVLPCAGIDAIAGDGERLSINWRTGHVKNPKTGAETTGEPLPPVLLEIAEKGGIVPILAAEGLLEDGEH